ncbi:Yip1 domain [Ostreococcus tauri]|uniref:Protein YIP n=1 Tax=Ostreococcus tauri TaxID=70448 RepID=A0A090MB42_OSTTA|nr:Yip1 domain [Ostreococcus tauri]CEF99952.1 Yip1 domain [Ostreococcus tauri]|eukprot:XP_022840129.1 Yip1 domain [Ostreococcus tauri]
MSNGAFDGAVDPLFTSAMRASAASAGDDGRGNIDVDASSWSTLDESIWETLARDAELVRKNCVAVLLPTNFHADGARRLREWDLWGPLFFVLALSALLSAGTKNASETFSVVFATVGIGAVALTANVLLLGGRIIFLQSVALLGYCVVPLVLAAAACLASENKYFRTVVVGLAVAWSCRASVPFVSAAVPGSRKALAVYPVMLMYLFLGWLAVARSGVHGGGATPAPPPVGFPPPPVGFPPPPVGFPPPPVGFPPPPASSPASPP